MKSIAAVAGAIVVSWAFATARAPAGVAFAPAPPGTVVQSKDVAFDAAGARDEWRAVVSKKLLGSGGGRSFYQWYLSIYQMRGGGYRLVYQSPGNGGPLARVTQAKGAQMWFPVQEVRIVGAAALMGSMWPGAQQLVVWSHEMSADCGSAAVTVFASAPGRSVAPTMQVTNPCDLNAGIAGDSIVLKGPYYAIGAPLCCPTKQDATAEVLFPQNRWMMTPGYFKLRVF
jgi:hypothetical protein